MLTAPPIWASRQLESICTRAQVDLPLLTWSRSSQDAGRYHPSPARIAVSQTRESDFRLSAEITLLHEIAHHLTHQITRGHGHCPTFWAICWQLYLDQGVPLDQAVYGEFSYHPGAEPALRALHVPLDAKVQAAGAYGTTCRLSDRLGAKIRRFRPPAGVQEDLDSLLAQQAEIQRLGRQHLRAWRLAS